MKIFILGCFFRAISDRWRRLVFTRFCNLILFLGSLLNHNVDDWMKLKLENPKNIRRLHRPLKSIFISTINPQINLFSELEIVWNPNLKKLSYLIINENPCSNKIHIIYWSIVVGYFDLCECLEAPISFNNHDFISHIPILPFSISILFSDNTTKYCKFKY